MHDGLHLRGRHGTARVGGQHHRGFGRGAVTHKHALLGRGQVHTGALHAANLHDGARQFLLHGGIHFHLLHELAGGHGRLVLQTVQTCGTGFGQALRGQKNARLMEAVAGHCELAGGRVDLGFVISCFERLKSRLLVGLLQAGHDRAVGRGRHPGIGQRKHDQHDQHHDQRQHPAHRRLVQHSGEGLRHAHRLPGAQTSAGCGNAFTALGGGQGHAAVGCRSGCRDGPRIAGDGHHAVVHCCGRCGHGVFSLCRSDRHVQNVFIRLEHFVAHLQGGLKSQR